MMNYKKGFKAVKKIENVSMHNVFYFCFLFAKDSKTKRPEEQKTIKPIEQKTN